MTESSIIIERDGRVLPLTPAPFGSEDDLQLLLAKRPEVLAGRSGVEGGIRRFALVCREAGIPDGHERSHRWSVDHVFVDDTGVPTLVEVKRSSDTRIRREVVGQLLDYAANAAVYWPAGHMRESFEDNCEAADCEPHVAIEQLIRSTHDPETPASEDPVEAFWARVDENLANGRLRLVFLADSIPTELQRVIEFLNEQMTRTEVLGVSVSRHTTEDLNVIVPTVVGQTAAAEQVKHPASVQGDELIHLAESSPMTAEALGMLRRLAADEGLVEAARGAAICFRFPGGDQDLMWFYPGQKNKLTLDFARIAEVADTAPLVASLRDIVHPRVTEEWPGIPMGYIAPGWERLRQEVLPAYLAAHRRAAHADG